MSFITTITKGIGKLAVAALLLGAFLVGLVTVVWLSLRGEELKVPEIIGKDKGEAEKELLALGLRMKKRADRYSQEKPDTILEQLPKSGETVKTGQVITVVVARPNPEGAEEPAVAKTPEENKDEDNESSVSPELRRPDKNKLKNKNANVNINSNKKGSLDNSSNSNKTSNKNSNSSSKSSNTSTGTTNKSESGTTNKGLSNSTTSKPTPAATVKPTSGETRERKTANN